MTKFNLEIFLNALYDQLNILIDSNISSPHELYDKFVTKFENVVDKFAPIRKASRKENKLRCKPCLTRGLLKSIRIKNKMYNNLREKPDTSQSHKYKIYRNLLNCLIKQAKVDYYHNVLKNNKNNFKKVWSIVNVGKRTAAKIFAHDKPPDSQSNLNKIKKISRPCYINKKVRMHVWISRNSSRTDEKLF